MKTSPKGVAQSRDATCDLVIIGTTTSSNPAFCIVPRKYWRLSIRPVVLSKRSESKYGCPGCCSSEPLWWSMVNKVLPFTLQATPRYIVDFPQKLPISRQGPIEHASKANPNSFRPSSSAKKPLTSEINSGITPSVSTCLADRIHLHSTGFNISGRLKCLSPKLYTILSLSAKHGNPRDCFEVYASPNTDK